MTAGMKVVCETDTGIGQEFLVTPDWDKEGDYYVLRCKLEELPRLQLQLKEWLRQIGEVIGDGS